MDVERELKLLTLLMLFALLSVTLVYAIAYNYTVQQTGIIQTIGCEVYAEEGQTLLTHLDWGDVFVNNTYERFGYLKSISSVNATVQYSLYDCPNYIQFSLFYQTGYWNNNIWVPASEWINMSYSPYMIQPNEWLRLKFQITISNDAIPGSFSFTIVISITKM